MKWYEYKAEVDDLHASEELKARLLAMQTAQSPAPAAPARKKAVYFPLKRVLGIAACFGVGFLCCGAIGFSTLGIGMRAGSANSTAAVMSARNAGAAGKLRELFAGCGTDRQPGEPKPAG